MRNCVLNNKSIIVTSRSISKKGRGLPLKTCCYPEISAMAIFHAATVHGVVGVRPLTVVGSCPYGLCCLAGCFYSMGEED